MMSYLWCLTYIITIALTLVVPFATDFFVDHALGSKRGNANLEAGWLKDRRRAVGRALDFHSGLVGMTFVMVCTIELLEFGALWIACIVFVVFLSGLVYMMVILPMCKREFEDGESCEPTGVFNGKRKWLILWPVFWEIVAFVAVGFVKVVC